MSKTWMQRLSVFVSKHWIATAAFIAIVMAGSIVIANSRNAISRVDLCSTRSLSGSAWLQGETGVQVGILTIENNGPTTCRLPTRPSVELDWPGGVLAIHQMPMPDDQSKSFGGASLTRLAPHAKAAVGLAWYNWCHSGPPRSGPFRGSLLVGLSSSPLRIEMKFAEAARCDSPLKQSTLSVGRFRLWKPLP
jgi:hypothetical protein